jgi:ankyrin repeat protein
MRIHLKKTAAALVATWIFHAGTGSYEDFFKAVRMDDAAAVTELLQRGFDPSTPSERQVDGLYMALQEGSLKVARVLIDWPKTNIEHRTPQDESPLMMAALKGHADLARRLVAKGADVNKPGWAPLHYAATSGNVEIIRLLLDNHAFIDAESPNGTTPLMMASQYGTPEAVRLLLDEGADPLQKNQLGLSALDFSRRASRPDAFEMLKQAVETKLLAQPPQIRRDPVPAPSRSAASGAGGDVPMPKPAASQPRW